MSTCKFVVMGCLALLVATGCPAPDNGGNGTGGTSGISGIVRAGPQCPVVRPGDPNCADKPLAATIIVRSAATNLAITQFTSAADGTFQVALAPGSYILDPQPGSPSGLPHANPQPVQVTAGQFTNVTIEYDTGIR